ncbi:MAG: DUF2203 domain-containing protein [Candidatus Latescibacterota bacterium]
MNPKFFSVEEADRLVSFLENSLERIQSHKRSYLWLQKEISILSLIVGCGAEGTNTDAVLLEEKTEKCRSVAASIEKDIARINETGCVLRDVDQGLVDFYSILDGNVVFLCWKKGEESVMFWHSTNTGFKGRQRIFRPSSM